MEQLTQDSSIPLGKVLATATNKCVVMAHYKPSSVGHLAGEFAEHLRKHLKNEDKELITDKEVLCLRLAGLCHDLGDCYLDHRS